MSRHTHFTDDSLSYGPKLYSQEIFGQLFPTFNVDQRRSAELIWTRILSKCGTDPDLPQITHAVDFGCGEGTFLKHLIQIKGTSSIEFNGIDCCSNAISIAIKKHDNEINLPVKECSPCPKEALDSLNVPWQSTVLMVMGHSWFHIDQESLLAAIKRHRPAIVLIDIYSSWDDVIANLREKQEASIESAYELEHGRMVTDQDGSTKCYWLRTEIDKSSGKINRGIWCSDGEPDWHFVTSQFPVTSEELFGGLTSISNGTPPEQVLLQARSNGYFVESVNEDSAEPAYVHDRQYSHNTGWGPMRCHVLVALDPVARILNRSWFKTIRSLIEETIINKNSPHSIAIHKMLNLFDETFTDKQEATISTEMTGSREGLVILPFDQNAIFARIVSLFDPNSKISDHPLLVEHPTRWQTQFPSANGLFQTCIGKSSSPQAFATNWAHDYELTPVDEAIIQLETKNLGLDDDGKWRGDQEAASYFMIPFYKGSLPLFCLALKFPRHFSPVATQFDVYLSTIESFHASIQTMLTDDVIRHVIIRPWIEDCLNSDWPKGEKEKSLEEKLIAIEAHLFGGKCSKGDKNSYEMGNYHRKGGVLSKEWKSWILGLPSFPINKMAKVIEENRRLLEIWQKEKSIALLDPALRISLWFQIGRFFEGISDSDNDPHKGWVSATHTERIHNMLRMFDETNDLSINKALCSSGARNYFGATTTQHFLFRWMKQQLNECSTSTECLSSPQHPFKKLKSVFCKTLGNMGHHVRFGLYRLRWLIEASCGNCNFECSGENILANSGKPGAPSLEGSYWSEHDPSMLLAEFINCLQKMGKISKVSMKTEKVENAVCSVHLNAKLSDKAGGEDFSHLNNLYNKIKELPVALAPNDLPECLANTDVLAFSFSILREDSGILIKK